MAFAGHPMVRCCRGGPLSESPGCKPMCAPMKDVVVWRDRRGRTEKGQKMRFFWERSWVPIKEFDPSRRSFLIGAAATGLLVPAIVRPELLMPVRRIILPEVPNILTKRTTVTLEGSVDNENWFPIVRVVGNEDTILRPENFPVLHVELRYFRQTLTPEWYAEPKRPSQISLRVQHPIYKRPARLRDLFPPSDRHPA